MPHQHDTPFDLSYNARVRLAPDVWIATESAFGGAHRAEIAASDAARWLGEFHRDYCAAAVAAAIVAAAHAHSAHATAYRECEAVTWRHGRDNAAARESAAAGEAWARECVRRANLAVERARACLAAMPPR